MPKVVLHRFFRQLHGAFDGIVVRKIGKHHFLSNPPKVNPERKPTANQLAFRARFAEASIYARRVQRDPELLAYYEPLAKERGRRVRAVAISDWFNPPTVDAI